MTTNAKKSVQAQKKNKVGPKLPASALKILEPRLQALRAELALEPTPADMPEHIHRLRVGCRRLRCALAVYADILPRRRYAAWRKKLKRLAGGMGAVRDADVQLELMSEIITKSHDKRHKPGFNRVKLRLTQRRDKARRRMDKVSTRFMQADPTADMMDYLAGIADAIPEKTSNCIADAELRHRAFTVILDRLGQLLVRAAALDAKDDAAILHAVRIAVKKLRYSLEVFNETYDERLDETIKLLRRAQQLLGRIHDCDIMLAYLAGFTPQETARVEKYLGHTRPLTRLHPGVNYLTRATRGRRRESLQEFHAHWQSIAERKQWDVLRAIIT